MLFGMNCCALKAQTRSEVGGVGLQGHPSSTTSHWNSQQRLKSEALERDLEQLRKRTIVDTATPSVVSVF